MAKREGMPIDADRIDEVLIDYGSFPASSQELARAAQERQAPRDVVNFFESVPPGTVFGSRQEVLVRAYRASMLEQEEALRRKLEAANPDPESRPDPNYKP